MELRFQYHKNSIKNREKEQHQIKINVFGYEERQPYQIHISKETFEDQMNLLLITEDEKKHYALIRDFNRFMYNQSKHQHSKHFCLSCLQCFSSKPQRPPPPPPKREPSSKIKELSRALKGHTKSYEMEIQDNLNPLNHFTKTKELVELHLKDLLKTTNRRGINSSKLLR